MSLKDNSLTHKYNEFRNMLTEADSGLVCMICLKCLHNLSGSVLNPLIFIICYDS